MIDYSGKGPFGLLLQWNGSVAFQAAMYAAPSALLAYVLRLRSASTQTQIAPPSLGFNHAVGVSAGALAILMGVRTSWALSRYTDSCRLLLGLQGEWFSAVKMLLSFTSTKVELSAQVIDFKQSVAGLISRSHAFTLTEISGSCAEVNSSLPALGEQVQATLLQEMKQPVNRTEACLKVLHRMMVLNLQTGILPMPPEMLRSIFEHLSTGNSARLQLKMVCDVPYPFPCAQTIALLLVAETAVVPVISSCSTESVFWVSLLAFVPLFCLHSLNMICTQLENPLGDNDNALPIEHFQREFDDLLNMYL